ncbi:hypothetical protein OOK31_38610 [Streptomyces sp. NBC_00249]|uniref:hypothetical protein n=1 Tax=Streptomyces sp. NBC_00249 TaxID=2975690 RepID=UPI00225A9CAD|nr:hypothetical protein [Streptomyces sp. NBC_00249]MCX5199725.1 hypothetical protein [Streptomyces sp. NBC_00249]
MSTETTTTAPELSGITVRPQLYPVPAQGLTLAQRSTARREAEGRHQTWEYPGYDEATPHRAAFTAGLAYGIWGVRPEEAEALGQLTRHLTTHAMRVLPAPRYIVTARWTGDTATVSVLARHSRADGPSDPGDDTGVRKLADSWGTSDLAAGPCMYAAARLSLT